MLEKVDAGRKCGRAEPRKGAQTHINIGRNALEGGAIARRAKNFSKKFLHNRKFFCYAGRHPREIFGKILATGVLGTVSGGPTVKTKISEETKPS